MTLVKLTYCYYIDAGTIGLESCVGSRHSCGKQFLIVVTFRFGVYIAKLQYYYYSLIKVFNDTILEKPVTLERSREMLRM